MYQNEQVVFREKKYEEDAVSGQSEGRKEGSKE